jgi:hypothetical protein
MEVYLETSKYSAAASLIGYLYQCRLALLESLSRLRSDPSISVSIETLDDVVFERDGNPTEIIQVKHHITRKASLTDASTDLWKTIRIWCDLLSDGLCDTNSILYLMTTEESTEFSAARYLRSEGRNIEEAEKLLLQTSHTSINESNKIGYQKFSAFSPEQRKALLERVLSWTIVLQVGISKSIYAMSYVIAVNGNTRHDFLNTWKVGGFSES